MSSTFIKVGDTLLAEKFGRETELYANIFFIYIY
jgi:hypothetical protein